MMHANFARVVLVGLLILPHGIAQPPGENPNCSQLGFQIGLTGQQISNMTGALAEIYLDELSETEYLIKGQETSRGLVVQPLIELSGDQLELLRKFYGALVPNGDQDEARGKRQEGSREACQGYPMSRIIVIAVTGRVCHVFTFQLVSDSCTPTSPKSPCFRGNECGCCTVSYPVLVGCILPNGDVDIVLVDLPICTCCECHDLTC
ncbi:uncharacterized protein [Apostichopus japonicus]|uniref:uncharacterized protein n=1 Tax=Stichopus japonicus TaxID=307972 RepID=UPI003AB6B038